MSKYNIPEKESVGDDGNRAPDAHEGGSGGPIDHESPFYDEHEPFPRFAKVPHMAVPILVTRGVIVLLAIVALSFVAASFGTPMTRVTFDTVRYKGVSFLVYMWTLGTGDGTNDHTTIYFDGYQRSWVNGGSRVCGILSLVCVVVGVALALAALVCAAVQQTKRTRDDVERERALQEDRREWAYLRTQQASRRESLTASVTTNASLTKDRAIARPMVFQSAMKPAWWYVERENRRRQLDYRLGVALLLFLVLTAVLQLIAVIYGGVYLKGSGFTNDLADIFPKLYVVVTNEELEHATTRDLRTGFWLELVALIITVAAVVVTVVPGSETGPAAGFAYKAGPSLLPPPPLQSGVALASNANHVPYGDVYQYVNDEEEESEMGGYGRSRHDAVASHHSTDHHDRTPRQHDALAFPSSAATTATTREEADERVVVAVLPTAPPEPPSSSTKTDSLQPSSISI